MSNSKTQDKLDCLWPRLKEMVVSVAAAKIMVLHEELKKNIPMAQLYTQSIPKYLWRKFINDSTLFFVQASQKNISYVYFFQSTLFHC